MHPLAALESALRFGLRLLAPGSCAACGAEPEPPEAFCAACGAPAPPDDGDVLGVPIVAAGAYAPPLSDAIRRFKFEARPELARELGRLLAPRVAGLGVRRDDAFVPVPLHRARLVERGYNQAALLARALSRHTRARFAPLLLERSRGTVQQARLGRDERAVNTEGAFAVRRRPERGRVVLVDDVVTTGATARACLHALRAADVEVVAVVALAHGSGRS